MPASLTLRPNQRQARFFICDGSLHPTNGGYNPVLTIMALAFRNASLAIPGT
jgi:choline dehydrogenase-like flavoprotein